MTLSINGTQFGQMVLHGAAAITLQKQQINDLNVFPVPDGDTGTNMSLTIGTAAAELRKGGASSVGQAAAITAGALLRGARGNSGVILSLLFRGLSKTLKGHDEADGALLAAAMQEGVAAAYGAVMKPAEGTVLTVSRLASKRAVEAAAENNDVEFVLSEAVRVGYEVLAQTTDMNPVLKKAGVVDAGGRGYLVILEGMLSALRGEPMPELDEAAKPAKADFNAFSAEEITFAFDTVFIVRKSSPDVDLTPLRAYLDSIGDSLSSARTTRPSRSTSTPTSPATPSARPRSSAPWSWPRSRTCAPRPRTWPPAKRPRAWTIWTRWRRSWSAPPPPRRRSGTAFWPCAPARGCPLCSRIWAWTG